VTAPLVVGYDLAEKFSGVVALDTSGALIGEWAIQSSHVAEQHRTFMKIREALGPAPVHFFIEDLFMGAALSASYKGAIQHQGALQLLIYLAWKNEPFPTQTWVMPTVWQKNLGCPKMISAKQRAALRAQGQSYPTTKSWAKEQCERMGYTPPEWSRGSKALEDMRDAALIASYGHKLLHGSLPSLARNA